MDKKIEELVEWVASRIYWVAFPMGDWSTATNQDYYKAQAQVLLSHPDLAYIDKGDEIDIPDCVFTAKEAHAVGFSKRSFLEAGWRKVIPLAEALKEK